MADLKFLAEKVSRSVDGHDGSWRSQKALLANIEELRVAALGPAEYTTYLRYQPLQNMCLLMALEMHLLDPIIARKGNSINATEVAQATESDKMLVGIVRILYREASTHPFCLVRIMRMLTALRICNEVGPETYTSNANAEYLQRPSSQGAIRFINGPTMKSMANAIPYMQANGGRFIQFPDSSKGETSIAEFSYGMSLWELFRSQPSVLADFVAYLSGRREEMVGYWFDIFPAKEILTPSFSTMKKDQVLIVDVGGNVGYDLQAFQKRYPVHVGRLVLQDLPENISKARDILDGTGIECMEHDFFTPQPIKGAKIYYFGGIYHDWQDAQAQQILTNTAAAMNKDSRIIIDEMPLPDEKAPLDKVSYDVLMMLNVSGIERTMGHWGELFESCGLCLVKAYPSKLDTVLEVRLK